MNDEDHTPRKVLGTLIHQLLEEHSENTTIIHEAESVMTRCASSKQVPQVPAFVALLGYFGDMVSGIRFVSRPCFSSYKQSGTLQNFN